MQNRTGTFTILVHHADEDDSVPPENSVLFYLGLRKAGVPAEMHIYQRGRHGVGLAPTDQVLSSWSDRLADWLTGFSRKRQHAQQE
jgi:dipeptidyl aminopeptidase/acylaminoacyl peptidase